MGLETLQKESMKEASTSLQYIHRCILTYCLLLGEYARALGGVVSWSRYGCEVAGVALCSLGSQPGSELAAETAAGLR